MYAIEKNIPLPRRSGRNAAVYPFHDMVVGDSFVVPYTKSVSARSSSQTYAAKHKKEGVKFASRKVAVGTSIGLRIWRVQ